MTYPEFIVQEYLSDVYRVILDMPNNEHVNRTYHQGKLGPFVHVDVQVEVVDIYTRSAKLHLTFEGIHREDIFYMSVSRGPDHINAEIYKKITKAVNKAMIEEGKGDWIREEYKRKTELLQQKLTEVVGKIKIIDGNQTNNLLD